MGKKLLTTVTVVSTILWAMGLAALLPLTASAATLTGGELIKASGAAVYYYGMDGKRYVFPNETTFKTWYPDFSSVVKITDAELAAVPIGGNATFRAGTYLVKITTDPKVYAVEPGGKLRWVETESVATTLYGSNWASMVRDVPDAFFTNYTSGSSVSTATYPTGSVVKEGTTTYYIDGSTKRMVDAAGMSANWFQNMFVRTASSLSSYVNGTAVTAKESGLTNVAGGASGPVATGALNIALASDTPASATLIADSTSTDGAQVNTSVMKMNFMAAGGDAKVTKLAFKRSGISSDTDLNRIALYSGNDLISDSYSLSNNVYTFQKSSGLFTVSSGATKSVWISVDLTNGVNANKSFKLSLEDITSVTAEGAISGNFPIMSNTFTTAQVSDLGKITLAHVTDPGTSLEAGTMDQTLWKFSLAGSDQKIAINKIRLEAIGTIDADVFSNLMLHDGTKQISVTKATLDSDKSVTFDMSSAPYIIDAGVTKQISLRGNVNKGTGRTFYFQVGKTADLVAVDQNYNVPIKVNQASVYSIIKATNTTTISAGTLTITRAASSPSGNIAKDATNVALGRWELKAVGEDVRLDSLSISTVLSDDQANLNNGKLVLDGQQIGTTKDLDSDATDDANTTDGADDASDAGTDDDTLFSFGSSVIIPAGTTKILEIYADLKDGNGASLTGSPTLTVSLNAGSSNALRMSTGSTFSTSTSAGNGLTVTSAALTVTRNAAVADKTIVNGSVNVLVASYLISAGTSEGVDLTSVTIVDRNAGNTANGSQGIGAGFDVLVLKSNGVQYGQAINSPSSTAGSTATFNLSTPLVIAAGQSKQVDIYANVLSSASTAWTATDAVFVSSASGVGKTTTQTVTDSDGDTTAATGTLNLTASAAGTLTAAVSSSPVNPDAYHVTAGQTGFKVAAWKFSASNVEDLKVTRLQVFEVNASDKPGNVKNLRLKVGGSVVQCNSVDYVIPALTTGSPDTATFDCENGLFVVPKNGSVDVELYVDTTGTSDGSFAANGNSLTFRITMPDETGATLTSSSEISAKGVTSNAFALENVGSDTNYDGNANKYVASKPVFSLCGSSGCSQASPSGVLQPGTVTVLRFKIAATGANDVKFTSGTHNIRFTTVSSGGSNCGGGGCTVTLKDGSNDTTLSTVTTADFTSTGATIDFTTGTFTIPAGTSREFYVEADLSDFATSGESFQLKLQNAAADLSWSDDTTSADINDTLTGKGTPMNGGVLVKPS